MGRTKNYGVPKRITPAQMQNDMVKRKALKKRRAGGSGSEFPFRVAKITKVDAKRMTCSLYVFTGNGDPYEGVALSFANAGARHFFGAIPEVNDLCVVGYSPAESGFTRMPYIVGWLVPGTDSGYDWVMSSATEDGELSMTPQMQELLKGTLGRRRHKLRQMEPGNIVASSSQGSDMILDESVTLANRRGNEIVLRDQDQAIVTRSLQTFHAGAGVRTYSGMVQRDSSLLPSQMYLSGTDWAGPRQVDAEGNPLRSAGLSRDDISGLTALSPNPIFDEDYQMPGVDPNSYLKRGLYIDDSGALYDQLNLTDSVYGGKPIYRVATDVNSYNRTNSTVDPGAETFSEWRVEVSHTSDGTLPVTEQTDGVDIDRLLPQAPKSTSEGGGDESPNNWSPNASFVSMTLGTAVGNDHTKNRTSYGLPLVPSLYSKDGSLGPSIRAAEDGEDPGNHAAFLLRVRNPYDPSQPEAFMAITKSGAYRTFFPGSGSASYEEYFQTGKKIVLGQDSTGVSQRWDGAGQFSMVNTGKGRSEDNRGLNLESVGGAVRIMGGGALTDTADEICVKIQSTKNTLIQSGSSTLIKGPTLEIAECNTETHKVNNTFSVNAGDSITHNTKTLNVTTNGAANYSHGGAKDGQSTNGPPRTTTFTGTPASGLLGDAVDVTEITFGGKSLEMNMGKWSNQIVVGAFEVSSMAPSEDPGMSPGNGILFRAGPPGAGAVLETVLAAGGTAINAAATVGNVSMKASTGTATFQGAISATIKSSGIVKVNGSAIMASCKAGAKAGGVLTSGCRNPVTGKKFILSGTIGVTTFMVK